MNNIFDLHSDIICAYKNYIDSFINIADPEINKVVADGFEADSLYPDPLLQFNPSFQSGGTVNDLVKAGVLADEFNDIFYDENGTSWSIYKHQEEAIRKGNEGKGFVVTSGTGSGKSLTYISTIFNHLFKNPGTEGVKAIIVYPLNALINSQELAIKTFNENYKQRTGKDLPFTIKKYTGQESKESREAIISNPPDILLTNYMMLELLMVRNDDKELRNSFLNNLKFLVFDELHVYKGRQGADVSLLIRRIKASAKNKGVICIGTSATMTSGKVDEQKEKVAEVAGSFFETKFAKDDVIVESLTYSTNENIPTKVQLIETLNTDLRVGTKNELLNNPLAIWLERTIAIVEDGNSRIRNKPKSLKQISTLLSEETGVDTKVCERRIIDVLIWAESINIVSAKEKKKDTVLPFKLHQFISQTGYVYLTLHKPLERYITLDPNPTIKLQDSGKELPVFQTVFSRISGHEFICVRKDNADSDDARLIFRDFNENQNPRNDDDLRKNDGKKTNKRQRRHSEYKDGYVLFEKDGYILDVKEYLEILPSAWVTKADRIDPDKEMLLPSLIFVLEDGSFSSSPNGGEKAWFLPAPLIYDPTCGIIYQEPKLSEKSKLISLGNEGRSTSTTIITLETLLALHKAKKPLKEQKLMSFTDNRQDASLQAGHFNDFVQVVHLRSAIDKVLRAGDGQHSIHELIYKVQDALALDESEYAINPAPNPNIPSERNRKALRDYITYRIILDLKRGWRYTLPNLEQTALLEINYHKLDDYCSNDILWQNMALLAGWSNLQRKDFILQVLNYFRNLYAIDFDMLRYENRLRIFDELKDTLNKDKLWSLDSGERIEAPNYLSLLGADKAGRETFIQSIGPASRLARFVKHEFRKGGNNTPTSHEYLEFMKSLLELLTEMQYLRKQNIKADKGDKDAYQLILSSVLWQKGDMVNVATDKTSYLILEQELKTKPHAYFQRLYQIDFSTLDKSYIAAEHSGQIPNEQKIDREDKFNEGKELSALYCSPTMELGIDISSLNIVHMRNVPPSPANYAQRSGRAGRSGQSALVFTYASKVSPHDKHYFKDPVTMVSGIVQAPRIDLSNEELIRSHLNATVLSFLEAAEFKQSIEPLIDFSGKTYNLKGEIKARYNDVIESRYNEIIVLVKEVVKNVGIHTTNWYTKDWLEKQVKTVPDKLASALIRWKKMYLDALRQMNEAHVIKSSPIIKDVEAKKYADRSYWLAENRLRLLMNQSDKNKNTTLSEFYTFRYLASEGFLPGYNFTRLPIRVFLGGKEKNEAISRPRFIGLREFGPNNMIYHNGGKYKVNRITPNDVSIELTKLKVSKGTNYAFLDEEGKGKNQDPITGNMFSTDNIEIFNNLLELEEAQSENTERISCMEEIRTSEGYETELYLNSADDLIDATKIKLTVDGDELMKLFYAPAAKLILVNKKWKRAKDYGFDISTKYGFFKSKKQLEKPNQDDPHANVMLFTYDTSDVLYVQPIKSLGLTEDGVVTLQYALEKAIELHYNIEPVEIDARLMGTGEYRNIMLYESAEGSIGVLKDIANNPAKLKELFLRAYSICGYDFETRQDMYPEKPKASYEDLLSYFNQMDHPKIDRHSIINALEMLINANPDDTRGGTYEEKYDELGKGLHHKSPGERQLLDYLFLNGYRLPDFTNYNLEQFYIQPDFVYNKEKALIFVDGGIHKNIALKLSDDKKRKLLEAAGFDVLVWDETRESIESFITRRQDIFRKVR